MWIASALWFVGFVAAAIDGEVAQTIGWLTFVVGGSLIASGVTERERRLAYVSSGLFLVGIVILIGDFLTS